MSLLDMLTQQLGGDALKQISSKIGVDEKKTGAATGAALSTLLAALQRNASQPGGAEALNKALENDHDGNLLGNLSGFLNNPQGRSADGDGILKHVLGSKRQRVENGLSKTTGLDAGSMAKLMSMLAPVVMGALGKQKRQGGLDAGALAGFLGQQRQEMERKEPQASGMLGALLDADGDGDVDMSDIAKKGIGMLGKLFSR